MMNDEQPDSHADDIVSPGAYEAPEPAKRNFLRWHLPRKQFVRHHQWCEQIGRMLDDSPLADGTLKYLGLPGVDLLDLRYFHAQVCEARNIKLRFLGFNNAAQPRSPEQTELNISLDEVRRMPRVDQSSDVIPDDFVLVANDASIAWKKARTLGPFDVINLDLCDGFGQHAPDTFEHTHYDAVNKLMALQARNWSPWLLLLTTRVGQQHVHPEALAKLIEKYLANLVSCPDFKARSREYFAIEDQAALNAAVADPAGLLPVFLCGLCKWLAVISLRHRPPTIVEVKSVIGYRVEPGVKHEDLFSLALRFTPTFEPAGDPVGLAKPSNTSLDECALAVKAMNRIARRKDADGILREDAALNTEMIDEAARLLELARYDPTAYRKWAQL